MQENVKVFTPEVLVEIFGDIKVKGDFSYKLRIEHINSRELSELAKVNQDYGMNFHVRRSGKGLIIYSPTIINESQLPETIKKSPRVRDFYEHLPQDARIAAFNNTAKNKWDMNVSSLYEAILRSFYLNHSPEGTEYWQDIILDHSGITI